MKVILFEWGGILGSSGPKWIGPTFFQVCRVDGSEWAVAYVGVGPARLGRPVLQTLVQILVLKGFGESWGPPTERTKIANRNRLQVPNLKETLQKSAIFARNSQNEIIIASDGNLPFQIVTFLCLRVCQKSQRFPACGGYAQSTSQKTRDFSALTPPIQPLLSPTL